MGKRWLPLESNPYVLNHFVSKLGYDTSKFFFCDVLGLDEVWLKRECGTYLVLNMPMYVGSSCLTGSAATGADACYRCHPVMSGYKRVSGSQSSRFLD